MKIRFAYLLCMITALNIHAQTKIDSLKLELTKAKEDTNKVNTMIKLCYDYQWANPDSALGYSLQALSLARRIQYANGEITILQIMGETLAIKGNFYEALQIQLKALHLCENLKLYEKVALSNFCIGNVYFYSKNYQKALDYYYKSKSYPGIVLVEQTSDLNIYINGTIGEAYFKLNQLDSALLYLQKAYALDIKRTDNRNWSIPYYFLGHIHAKKKQYALAMDYYRLGLSVSTVTKNTLDGIINMAVVFKNTGMIDSAIIYSKMVIKEGLQKSFLTQVIDASALLKELYKTNNEKDSAFFYQEIMLAAKDSLFSTEKLNQLQNLTFTEHLRQQEFEERKFKELEDRKRNIQYAAIAIGIICFLILFLLLSRSIIVNEKWISFLGILGLLVVFEFINLIIHPLLGNITHHSPLYMLIILVAIAALLIPLHHRLENWVNHKMVEKNKRIRLAAAKKTIEQLG